MIERPTPIMTRDSRKTKDQGVEATNRDFLLYDQVEKRQAYRLAEGEGEAFDEDYEIRTCDVGRFLPGDASDRAAFAAELGSALKDIGFAVLEGHGLDPALFESAEREVPRVFCEHDLETKLRFRAQREGSLWLVGALARSHAHEALGRLEGRVRSVVGDLEGAAQPL